MEKLIKRWKSETPALAKAIQWILGSVSAGIGAVLVFFATLPDEFRVAFTQTELKIIAGVGAACVFLLQFMKKND